jgi:hypothetical protein
MAILAKAICGFNSIPIKIKMAFSIEKNLIVHRKHRKPQIAQKNSEQINNPGQVWCNPVIPALGSQKQAD